MVRTGGEVDAMCTKCKMVLAHTVIAMVGGKPVRVQCNTCSGQHNYRPPAGASASKPRATPSPRTSSSGERTGRVSPVRPSFDDLLATKKSGLSKPYSPKTTYSDDDVLQHPTFGTGFVSEVRPDKVTVTFRAGEKVLVHGRS